MMSDDEDAENEADEGDVDEADPASKRRYKFMELRNNCNQGTEGKRVRCCGTNYAADN